MPSFIHKLFHNLDYFVDSGKYVTENEGNCLRFFALQAVGKVATRKILDSMPDTFERKWDRFEKYCKQRKGKFLECMHNGVDQIFQFMVIFLHIFTYYSVSFYVARILYQNDLLRRLDVKQTNHQIYQIFYDIICLVINCFLEKKVHIFLPFKFGNFLISLYRYLRLKEINTV